MKYSKVEILRILNRITDDNTSDSFSHLLKITGLSLDKDFVGSDLTNVDFGEFDYKRLNLTDAKLDGAICQGHLISKQANIKERIRNNSPHEPNIGNPILSYLQMIRWKVDSVSAANIGESRSNERQKFFYAFRDALYALRDLSVPKEFIVGPVYRIIYIDTISFSYIQDWLVELCRSSLSGLDMQARSVVLRSFNLSSDNALRKIHKYDWKGSRSIPIEFSDAVDIHVEKVLERINKYDFKTSVEFYLDKYKKAEEALDAIGIAYVFINSESSISEENLKSIISSTKIPFWIINVTSNKQLELNPRPKLKDDLLKNTEIFYSMKRILQDYGLRFEAEDRNIIEEISKSLLKDDHAFQAAYADYLLKILSSDSRKRIQRSRR